MPIKITNFGGVVPKANPRALPDDAAQIAQDLQPGTREFRPIGEDTVAVANTGVPDPLTIHRLARKADGSFNVDMSTGWIVKAADMSFAKVPINNDTTERTVATFDDGQTPPRVYDASDLVTGRQLGVPSPDTAPVLTVNAVAQFSTEDRAAAVKSASDYFATLSKDPTLLVPTWYGAATTTQSDFRPGAGTTGYLDRVNAPSATGDDSLQVRGFRLSSTGGANDGGISDTYDSDNGPEAYAWVLDPSLGGYYRTSPTGSPLWPTWASTNKDHYCVPFTAYAIAYSPDETSLRTLLAAMTMPGTDSPTPLFTDGQLDDIITAVDDALNAKWTAGAPHLNALKAEVDTMHTILGGGAAAQRTASLTAFYALSDVTAQINNAVANLAEQLFGMATQANVYIDAGYPGG